MLSREPVPFVHPKKNRWSELPDTKWTSDEWIEHSGLTYCFPSCICTCHQCVEEDCGEIQRTDCPLRRVTIHKQCTPQKLPELFSTTYKPGVTEKEAELSIIPFSHLIRKLCIGLSQDKLFLLMPQLDMWDDNMCLLRKRARGSQFHFVVRIWVYPLLTRAGYAPDLPKITVILLHEGATNKMGCLVIFHPVCLHSASMLDLVHGHHQTCWFIKPSLSTSLKVLEENKEVIQKFSTV